MYISLDFVVYLECLLGSSRRRERRDEALCDDPPSQSMGRTNAR